MKNILLASTFLCASLWAQDITTSSDSINVYNSSLSSFAGLTIFTNHSTSAIHLDSAFVQIDEMDTAGLSVFIAMGMLETDWEANNTGRTQFTWYMDSVSPNLYRLRKKGFIPATATPLTFGLDSNTAEIFLLKIGNCFQCAYFPIYPRFIKGSLILYFSNNQIINLRLYSNDLRAAIKHDIIGMIKSHLIAKNDLYLMNGQQMQPGFTEKSIKKNVLINK